MLFLLFPLLARGDDLIGKGDTWRYLRGLEEPAADLTSWRKLEFPDQSWESGLCPFFYGEPISGTELLDMRGGYTCLYLRKTFVVDVPADFQSVDLTVLSDDGFVAYLNGQEIVRFNLPDGDLPHDAQAFGALAEPLFPESYSVPNPSALLKPGTNILAIQAFNSSLSQSSDFALDALLSGVRDTTAPRVDRILPTPGAILPQLNRLEILFDEPVDGVDAADLLINGRPAESVSESSTGQFVFVFQPAAAGPVEVRFRQDHGIHDRAGSKHPFLGGQWTFEVNPNAPPPSLEISEFMADNEDGIRDDDGDRSDWIEIFNGTDATASLGGWSLTDDVAQPRKWIFPAVVIEPHEFLVVYASGKNRTNAPAPLHANFRLSKDGGYLSLNPPSGAAGSSFRDYPAQHSDVSYGRANGAPNIVGYFSKPTPGEPNSTSGQGFAPEVQFSEVSGTFRNSISVALSTSNAESVIHYTIDGSVPDETSPVYDAPLMFNTAVRLRARASLPGMLPGPVRTEMYLPLSQSLTAFKSNLPLLVIHGLDQGRPPSFLLSPAFVELFEPGADGRSSLTNRPTLARHAGISERGSSTAGYSKVSLKLELQDEYGADLDEPLLGMPADSDWVLYAPNYFEPILIHNPFAHQLSRDIGRYSPRTRFVEVYFISNGFGPLEQGHYHGIYVLEEKIKIGEDRVDINRLQPQHNTPPSITGGYLFKIDRSDPGDNGIYTGHQGVLFVDPKEEEILQPERAAQYQYIQQYLGEFDSALYSDNYKNPTTGYPAYIDVGSWIDHHLLNVLTFNVDALRLSAYFYKERSGKLHFGPLWDFDRALNSTDGRDANPRVWRSTSGDLGTDFFNYPWWDRLFSDLDFFQKYIDRYQQVRKGAFATTNLWRLVDDLTGQVRQAQPREQARWGVEPRGGFSGEIRSLKTWLSNRVEFMDGQFVRPPSFGSTPGNVPRMTSVGLSVPVNTVVYFTRNGRDPRLPGGGIAPEAEVYSQPLMIDANTRILARAHNPNHTARTGANNPPLKSLWSGLLEGAFITDPLPLRLTEIMFHPAGDGSESDFQSEDFEFIELLNTGSGPINLSGSGFVNGIEFDFSPPNTSLILNAGQRVVLARNVAAYTYRYPTAQPPAGEFRGNLDNDGDRLSFRGTFGESLLDFRYEATWYPLADGEGYSLVPTDEESDFSNLADPRSWTVSADRLGSPGKADAASESLHLQLIAAGDALKIRFRGRPGFTYGLEATSNLNAGSWTLIQQKPAAETETEFSDAVNVAERYYRVRRL